MNFFIFQTFSLCDSLETKEKKCTVKMVQRYFNYLFVVVVVLLQSSILTTAKGECVEGDLLPYPDNCELFYKCAEGSLLVLSCPDGLHFNPIEEVCDWPEEAKCGIAEKKCTDGDLSPNPENCQLYFQCAEGSLHVLSCPDGLHFNAVEQVCDWPEEAKCAISEGKCTDGDLSPNPENCQQFFKCFAGSMEVFTCPDGLHFNAVEKVCDWPGEAKCAIAEEKCTEGDLSPNPENCQQFFKCAEGSLQVLSCPDGLHFNAIEQVCDWPEEAKCAVTEEKCTDGDLLPHSESCELFYQCSGGSLHLQSCPNGLHFNSFGKMCDFPDEAQC